MQILDPPLQKKKKKDTIERVAFATQKGGRYDYYN